MDFFDRADEYPDLREGLHEDAHAGQTTDRKKSSRTEAPGQRLLRWLTWGVIAVLLAYGLVLTTVHVLARIVGMPRAQIILAHLYTGKYWWHPADKVLLDTQVDKLVQAMAGFKPPAMGQTTLTAAQQTALAPVLAASWH